jgi:hypothetical protein
MNQEPKKIWIKNTTNGLIYQVWEHERHLYDLTVTVPATPEEVEAWVSGTYWNQTQVVIQHAVEVKKAAPTPQKVEATEPQAPANQGLDGKTKAELLEILRGLDPETEHNEKTTNAVIIQSIEVFQTLK